ncbi:hypothetical protein PVIIG_06240 [Plasmodium vivax India VII]|uniref:VIR protein n=1 Tax=Plasmodium vivax India VII TaxID=1077284 RepID=A0A0J9S4F2_PLAVI|nr:hypothetical protein PVIIG_06240 [Plasmodium vivax India VII]
MTYPCKETYDGYPSYECYEKIKYQFGDKLKGGYSIIEKVKNFEKDHAADIIQKLNGLSDAFINLKKYLSNHHVFASGEFDGQGTCNYISYLLCEQISKNIYGERDKDKFNILKEFVDRFNIKTNSYICRDNVKHLNNNEFLKMKALYQLYDNYTPLTYSSVKWDDRNCSNISYLVYLYNTFIRNYKSGSLKFNTILTGFQGLIKNIVLKATPHCSGKDLAVGNPVLFEETEVRVPPSTSERGSNQSQRDILVETGKSKPSGVTSLPTSEASEEERDYPHNAKVPQVSDPLRVTTNLVSHKDGEQEDPHKILEHSQQHNSLRIPESYVSQGSHRLGKYYGSSEYLDTYSTHSQGEEISESTLLIEQGLGNEDVSVLGKMKTALSTMVDSVEPAPILGVSGGMGALFLLFKVYKVLKIYSYVYNTFK